MKVQVNKDMLPMKAHYFLFNAGEKSMNYNFRPLSPSKSLIMSSRNGSRGPLYAHHGPTVGLLVGGRRDDLYDPANCRDVGETHFRSDC